MAVIHSQYREEGKVAIDEKACNKCGACARICASGVIRMENQAPVVGTSPFGCIACGHCMMVCPHDAVKVTGRGMKAEDIQPMPKEEERATADQLGALMQARRSVRKFKDQPVDAKAVERIVRMASTAPMGIPPWDVGCVSVIGKAEVRKIADEVVKGYEGFLKMFRPWVLKVMRPIMGKAKYEMFKDFIRPLAQGYVDAKKEGHDYLFYEAPALLIFHHSPYADAGDAMIACTYAMLAAESLGLGNTMIGGAPPVLQRNKSLCRRLGIPDANKASIALILGHSAVSFDKTIRRRFSHETTVGM